MKKIIVASALALGLGFSSCNSYLDINTDPNSPAEENIETYMLMPVIEMNMASSYGNFLRIAGGFHAQQYAHLFGTSNYVDYSQFNMSATRSSGTYTQFNQKALSNLKTLMNKSAAEEDWGEHGAQNNAGSEGSGKHDAPHAAESEDSGEHDAPHAAGFGSASED